MDRLAIDGLPAIESTHKLRRSVMALSIRKIKIGDKWDDGEVVKPGFPQIGRWGLFDNRKIIDSNTNVGTLRVRMSGLQDRRKAARKKK